ncbi:DNA methyltransferase [Mycolicibacterium fortuitum]|uniref:DNA methyltransferase n=1 Tax=Mycolicibacterium fortuitum TaxID=1766 RepID=UPI00148F6F74|nr:site-specific DNA-methyltransferase [Mycolicibacterium fortuitum]
MSLYYSDAQVTLYHGDCLEVLAELPANSVDAVVTDPPYDLTAGKKGGTGAASVNLSSPYGRSRIGTGNGAGGFMGQSWDATGVAFDPETWRRVARVLKPGGHLLAFGGSRTWHRLAAAVEDAGFEVRDSIAWLYGSGFPKSLDVAKAIDKSAGYVGEVVGTESVDVGMQGGHMHTGRDRNVVSRDVRALSPRAEQWQGWGTALKPSFEPIVVARKPLAGTVAANVLEHGTGALNIDACRIEANDDQLAAKYASVQNAGARSNNVYGSDSRSREGSAPNEAGRWPTNVVLDQAQAQALDQQSGVSQSRIGRPRGAAAGDGWGMTRTGAEYDDQGGASRFFPVFRYEAKAPSAERPSANGVAHPTVKPLELMRWLVRLVTPPNGLVLEPFAGSGTTAEACIHEHMRCIAIEREADYLPLITARLTKPIEVGFDFGSAS